MKIRDRFFSFQGRLNRREYWRSLLCVLPVTALAFICFVWAGNVLFSSVTIDCSTAWLGTIAATLPFGIPSGWAGLAVTTKRLHDCDRSPWILALTLIPFAGWIFALWVIREVWFIKGTVGSNRFGKDSLG